MLITVRIFLFVVQTFLKIAWLRKPHVFSQTFCSTFQFFTQMYLCDPWHFATLPKPDICCVKKNYLFIHLPNLLVVRREGRRRPHWWTCHPPRWSTECQIPHPQYLGISICGNYINGLWLWKKRVYGCTSDNRSSFIKSVTFVFSSKSFTWVLMQ